MSSTSFVFPNTSTPASIDPNIDPSLQGPPLSISPNCQNQLTGGFQQPKPSSHPFGGQQATSRPSEYAHMIAQADASVLISTRNAAYMRVQIENEQLKTRVSIVETEKRQLEMSISGLTAKCETLLQTNSCLISQLAQATASSSASTAQAGGSAPPLPQIPRPPALDRSDYPSVRFWKAHAYKEFIQNSKGVTNGNSTRASKRGPRTKQLGDDENPNTSHVYLEDSNGAPIANSLLEKMSLGAHSYWRSLLEKGLAPASWGNNGTSFARDFYASHMLTDYEFLRYNDGEWKLWKWTYKNYLVWAKQKGLTASRPSRMKKKWDQSLDDPSLHRMSSPVDEESEEEIQSPPTTNTTGSVFHTPVNSRSDAGAVPSLIRSPLEDEPVLQPDLSVSEPQEGSSTSAQADITTISSTTPYSDDPIPSSADSGPQPSSVPNPTPAEMTPPVLVVASASTVQFNSSSLPPAKRRRTATHKAAEGVEVSKSKGACKKTHKPQAVSGKPENNKNIALKCWLAENPGGELDAFEDYWKGMSHKEKLSFKKTQRASANKENVASRS